MIKQRIVTALLLAVALVAAIFYLPPNAMAFVLAILFLGGVWEWAGFFGYPRGPKRLPLVGLGALAMAFSFWWVAERHMSPMPVFAAAALFWLTAFFWVLAYPTRIPRWTIALSGLVVLVPAWLAAWRLLAAEGFGARWLLFVFVLVWAADTGAFFAGRRFGRHKLAPNVSPGKTWEGAIGGFALALAVSAAAAVPLAAPMPVFLALSAAAVAASVVGDLTVSLFKRGAGLKDSGRIFPGHGGILDRIDSLCAAAPVLIFGLALVGYPV